MQTTKGTLIIAATLVCISACLNSACAADVKRANSKDFTNATTYTWYDGDRARTIWMNPNTIAEFNGAGAKGIDTSPLANSATALPGKHQSIRLWRLNSGQTSKSRMQQLRQELPGGKLSPVMHDGPSESGRKRALPGNIVVHLDPQWTRQQVNAWLAENRLEVVKPLNIGPNIFVLKTGPGLEALEKANAIYQSGSVVAAYPNWWQEVSRR